MKVLISLAFACCLSTAALSAPVLSAPTSGGLLTSNSGLNWGWEFNLASTFQINSLGLFDSGGDGLFGSHEVGIFDTLGNLLASTTVSSSDTLVAGFRYHALVAPAILGPGNYVLGAIFPTTATPDGMFLNSNGAVILPGVSFVVARLGSVGAETLGFPDQAFAGNSPGYFGPTFDATALGSAVPELDTRCAASTLGFMCLLLASLEVRNRRQDLRKQS